MNAMATLSTFVRGRTQPPAQSKPDEISRSTSPLFSRRNYNGTRAESDTTLASNLQHPVPTWHGRRLSGVISPSPSRSRSSTTERINPNSAAQTDQNGHGQKYDGTSWDEHTKNLPSAWDTDVEGIDDTVSELQIDSRQQIDHIHNLQDNGVGGAAGAAQEDEIKEEEDDVLHTREWPPEQEPLVRDDTLTERNMTDYPADHDQPYNEFGLPTGHIAEENEISPDKFSELMRQAANIKAMINAEEDEALPPSRFAQSTSFYGSKKHPLQAQRYTQNRPYSPQESYPPTTPGGSDDEVELVSAPTGKNEYQQQSKNQAALHRTPRKSRQDGHGPNTVQRVNSTPQFRYDRQQKQRGGGTAGTDQPRGPGRRTGVTSPPHRPSSTNLPLRGPGHNSKQPHHAGAATPEWQSSQPADNLSMDASAESAADDTIHSLSSRPHDAAEEEEEEEATEAEALDYDPAKFVEMDYSELRDQPFDLDPNALPSVLPPDALSQPVSEQMKTIIAKPREQQRQYFSSLTIDQWEDCGDLFVERFGELIAKMKDTRRAKRQALAAFEHDVALREETVRNKKATIEGALQTMRKGGQEVLRGKGQG